MEKWVKKPDKPRHLALIDLVPVQDYVCETPIFLGQNTTLGQYIDESGNKNIWPIVNRIIDLVSKNRASERHGDLRNLFDTLSEASGSPWNSRIAVGVIDKAIAKAVKDAGRRLDPDYVIVDDRESAPHR